MSAYARGCRCDECVAELALYHQAVNGLATLRHGPPAPYSIGSRQVPGGERPADHLVCTDDQHPSDQRGCHLCKLLHVRDLTPAERARVGDGWLVAS